MGFGQQEVTSASQGKRALTHWYIETNENSILPPSEAKIINYLNYPFGKSFESECGRLIKD